ncbi:MAG: hypothetical protein ACOX8X_02315 [Methanomethylophilus sp.]|jgi:hypothetical protein
MEKPIRGRYSWPLASPGYEVSLADAVLEEEGPRSVLDPYVTDGAVSLACAYRGISGTGVCPDPFLLKTAQAKTGIYGSKVPETLGYSCAVNTDEVFWESDTDPLPEIAGTYNYPRVRGEFLGRWLHQLPNETRDEIRDLLFVSYLRAAELLQGTGDFDESVGMELFWEGVSQVRDAVPDNPDVPSSLFEGGADGIPCPLRKSYSLVLSFLPSPSMSYDTGYRTLAQRSGYFADPAAMRRRDAQCIGMPLEPMADYMRDWRPSEKDPESLREALAELGDSQESMFVRRYAEETGSLIRSVGEILGKSKAVLFAGNAVIKGTEVPVEALIPELAERAGLKCQEPEKVHVRDNVRGLADWRFDLSK